MQLSVIILNYNVRYFLEQCLLSVQNALQDIEGEIIVVDNNSSDDSCAMVKERFPDVLLIENNENLGFPKGNNIGVKHAKGEYICILNPDTVVQENTFKKMLAFAQTKVDFGIGGVKFIDGTGSFLPECKRGVPTPWVAFTKITGLYRLFPKAKFLNKYYASHLSENETGKVDILAGAFMLLKRDVYINIGGFDENCFMYSDDIDLSYMVLQSGKNNYYYPETSIIHYKGESTVKDGTYLKRFREAMHFFYKKHFKPAPAFNLFMSGGTFFFALLKKNKKGITVIPSGYILFSENEQLWALLEKQLGKTVILASGFKDAELLKDLPFQKPVEVIFDNDFFSFTFIIKTMQKYSNKGYTFKTKPAGCNFIIGSNSSDGKGEIVILKAE